MQITIWGGNRLKDYASKSWSGMLTDYYLPRWQVLFNDLKLNKENFDEVLTQSKIQELEEQWTEKTTIPSSPKVLTKDEYIGLIKGILE